MEEHELPEERRDRPRSNTWPLPEPPSLPTEPVKSAELPEQTSPANLAKTLLNDGPKKSSRKNAWGNLSYADLITQAIQSSSEKRLTLAEIYEWMVHTIPYFKDKGDSNSSAGWKNSIRHNLSLHSKFIRVQNEGNGKSSWWMLNPDAKPGKTVRRPRSGSLDSPKSEGRKRGRTKKDKIKETGERPVSPSVVGKNGSRGINRSSSPGNVSPPSSSIVESLLPDHLSNSFGRPRTSSNASTNSSIPGRLSPIHDQDELDDQLDDCGMSPCGGNMATSSTPNPATDELIKTIEERMYVESPIMKQSRSPVSMISRGDASPINEMPSPSTPMSSGYDTGYDSSGYLTNHHAQQNGIFSPLTAAASAFTNVPPQQVNFQNHNGFPEIQQPQPREAQQPNLLQYNREPIVDQEMEVQQPPAIYGGLGQNFNQNIGLNHTHNTISQNATFSEPYFHVLNRGNPAIVINNNPAMQSTTVQHHQSPPTMNAYSRVGNQNPELTIAGRYPFPSDLEGFGIADDLDFDCDVQSIIQSEMGDGGFDCLNFDQLIAAQSANTPVSVGEMRLF